MGSGAERGGCTSVSNGRCIATAYSGPRARAHV